MNLPYVVSEYYNKHQAVLKCQTLAEKCGNVWFYQMLSLTTQNTCFINTSTTRNLPQNPKGKKTQSGKGEKTMVTLC